MRRPRFDDSGQSMLPFMVLLALSLVVIMVSLMLPWGAATTEKAQTQTAADAGALAALGAKREWWLERTSQAGRLDLSPGASGILGLRGVRGVGCDQAVDYARQNGAGSVQCRGGNGRRSSVTVDVVNSRTSDPDTGLAEATATARQDIDYDGCSWVTVVPPLTAANGGPPEFPATLRCGEWSVDYQMENLPPYRTRAVLVPPGQLFKDLEPRLER